MTGIRSGVFFGLRLYCYIFGDRLQACVAGRHTECDRPSDKCAVTETYFSTKTYVEGTQKNPLNETVLLSTQNICLDCWVRK